MQAIKQRVFSQFKIHESIFVSELFRLIQFSHLCKDAQFSNDDKPSQATYIHKLIGQQRLSLKYFEAFV